VQNNSERDKIKTSLKGIHVKEKKKTRKAELGPNWKEKS
jgi:hypothetical protein